MISNLRMKYKDLKLTRFVILSVFELKNHLRMLNSLFHQASSRAVDIFMGPGCFLMQSPCYHPLLYYPC